MRKEIMEVNGEKVELKIIDLGYNFGDPIRNGTVVEIDSDEGFCRLSDGDPGKLSLYAYHKEHSAFVAAAKAYLSTLFPGMEVDYYFPDIKKEGKYPSPPVLYLIGIGPSEDGKTLYADSYSLDQYNFVIRWSRVWRYWTSYNMCHKEGVTFFLDNIRGSGIPKIYQSKNRYGGKKVILVEDADLDGRIGNKEYFEKLFQLIDQMKEENN